MHFPAAKLLEVIEKYVKRAEDTEVTLQSLLKPIVVFLGGHVGGVDTFREQVVSQLLEDFLRPCC